MEKEWMHEWMTSIMNRKGMHEWMDEEDNEWMNGSGGCRNEGMKKEDQCIDIWKRMMNGWMEEDEWMNEWREKGEWMNGRGR